MPRFCVKSEMLAMNCTARPGRARQQQHTREVTVRYVLAVWDTAGNRGFARQAATAAALRGLHDAPFQQSPAVTDPTLDDANVISSGVHMSSSAK